MPTKKILYLGSDPSRFVKDDVDIVHLQLFDIVPRPWDLPTIASALADWTLYTHIIFTSKHSVAILHDVLLQYQLALRFDAQVIAVGRTTAHALEQKGWQKPLVAKEERQEGVIELLRSLDWNDESYVLMPRSSIARGTIEQFLVERRIRHQICDLYDTRPRRVDPFPNLEEFDEIFFTSPSTVSAFFSQVREIPKRPVLRAIGEVTWQNLARATMICTTSFAKRGATMPYKLPELPYDFNALEPVISAEIMTLHYTKHHQGYVNNLNAALEKYAQAEKEQDVAAMIALQQAIRFNGGGHVNHSVFWTNLAPVSKGGGEPPKGELLKALQRDFGSFDSIVEKLTALAGGVQGSGWAWLGYNKGDKRLQLASCANQDPLSTAGLIPLLGIDVWEHAYYLQYKNVRADYVKNIWKVVSWKNVEDRFLKAAAQ